MDRSIRKWAPLLVVWAALAVPGCSYLQPAAPYDPEIETTVREFDREAMRFIADMQGLAGTPAGTYGENVEFYKKWKVELTHLRNRAIATDTGTGCGPDDQVDRVIGSGIAGLNEAIEKGEALFDKPNREALQPARDWAKQKLDAIRAKAHELGVDPDRLAPESDRLKAIQARVDKWQNAYNRIRGAIALAGSAAADPDAEDFRTIRGGCTTKMLGYLADQLAGMERFHMKQRDLGIPPRRAVVILISVPVQVILKVQERKKALTGQGFL